MSSNYVIIIYLSPFTLHYEHHVEIFTTEQLANQENDNIYLYLYLHVLCISLSICLLSVLSVKVSCYNLQITSCLESQILRLSQ